MKGRKNLFLAALLLAALSCGPKKKSSAPVVLTRDFPRAEVPMMITQPQERLAWLGQHFWDRFTAPDSLYYCDSLTVNGVPKDELEKQVGVFATLLQEMPLPEGKRSMERLYEQLEAFQQARPQGNVFPQTVALVSHYLYDPNSPVRSEDLYLPFVSRLATSALIDPDYRHGYAWDARMCELNRIGTPAADFVFVDTAGKRRSLYSIKAERILLIFGNPDCHACKELQEALEGSEELSGAIASGELKVVDIYIDEDVEAWKEHIPEYPASWINGYDPGFVIRTDLLYNVRALPSLYLLSADKTVLLKDATTQQFFSALGL